MDLFDSLAMPDLETGLHSVLFFFGGVVWEQSKQDRNKTKCMKQDQPKYK